MSVFQIRIPVQWHFHIFYDISKWIEWLSRTLSARRRQRRCASVRRRGRLGARKRRNGSATGRMREWGDRRNKRRRPPRVQQQYNRWSQEILLLDLNRSSWPYHCQGAALQRLSQHSTQQGYNFVPKIPVYVDVVRHGRILHIWHAERNPIYFFPRSRQHPSQEEIRKNITLLTWGML